jgi:chromosome partitioning protein
VAEVLAVANPKGGVGKTTTTHTLAAALAERGPRTAVVDLDPQACLTYSVGLDPEGLAVTLHDVLVGRNKVNDALVDVGYLSVVPASIELTSTEIHLAARVGREHALARALAPLHQRFDLVLVDCPPSLGILTINALTAATRVVVPFQCETLGHRGVSQLLETVADVRTYTQPDLEVLGVVATMADRRIRHTQDVLTDVQARYGLRVLEPLIPRSVRFAEAPAAGRSVLEHAPRSPGAVAYRDLARTVLAHLTA